MGGEMSEVEVGVLGAVLATGLSVWAWIDAGPSRPAAFMVAGVCVGFYAAQIFLRVVLA